MNSILDEFVNEMELLKSYIDFQNLSYKNQAKIEKLKTNSVLKSLTVSKIKQFDFNSHIIAIYGAYENFIEQLLVKYLKQICSIITCYDLLPKEIQKNNFKKTFDIIKQIDYRKNRNLKTERLIEILHKNVNENSSVINIEAFKNHSANFRISVIDNYFNEIGIKGISTLVRQYEPFKTYLERNISDFSSKKNTIIFQILEHICNLRNDVAHGENNIQLLNKSILVEYIDFMQVFATSLFALINSSYLSKIYDLHNEEIDVIDIFNKEILCFNTKGVELDKQTKILVKSENHFPNIFIAKIVEIQHDRKSILKTELNTNIDIGVKIDKKIKKTMSFKLIKE